ncbi:glycosyl transferase [Roseovarius sp. HI0049]|nr:glycosyl transferase [Roseovarius sp. HI0049]
MAKAGSSFLQFSIGDQVVRVNLRDFAELAEAVGQRFAAREGFALATINLDHLVKMRSDQAFARAYARHDMVVADGNPIVWLSRLAGRPVELLPGSDLIRPLCRMASGAGVPVAMVGSDEATLQAAGDRLEAELQGLQVVVRHAPPMGFDPDGAAAAEILERLEAEGVGLCFLALGAPKQERFAARGRELAPRVGFASIGAGLDFISGRQKRAPIWVRRLAAEWVWRALGDLRRLGPRYAKCIAILPRLVVGALRLRMSGGGH